MPTVSADPEKLRALGKEMSRFSGQIQDISKSIQRRLDATGWNDKEKAKFQGELTVLLRSLQQQAAKLNSQFVPTLNRKAMALEQYRNS